MEQLQASSGDGVSQDRTVEESSETKGIVNDSDSCERFGHTMSGTDPAANITNAEVSWSNCAPGIESTSLLERFSAKETFQLIKEFKKREFLYASQIVSLQKQLSIQSTIPAFHLPSTLDLNRIAHTTTSKDTHSASVAHLFLLDPAINLEFRELRSRLYEKEVELQRTRDELRASSFSAESVMGRRLINKCKALQEENTEMGRMLFENQLQPLRVQIGVLRKQLLFFKQQLKTMYELNMDLEEENEALAQQLQDLSIHQNVLQREKQILEAKLVEQDNQLEDWRTGKLSLRENPEDVGSALSNTERGAGSRGRRHRRHQVDSFEASIDSPQTGLERRSYIGSDLRSIERPRSGSCSRRRSSGRRHRSTKVERHYSSGRQ